jgi:hypothetical protein
MKIKAKTLGITLMLILSLALTACSETTTTAPVADDETSTANTSEVVYEDSTLTVTFKGVSEVAGQIGMSFTLDNTGADEITVLPIKGSVNGVMVQFVSGTPATILPGKTANQVWMANPEVVGATADEVTSIEVILQYGDTTTDPIHIDL